jgi:hypothetical protein
MDMEFIGPAASFTVKAFSFLRRVLLGLPKISVTGGLATVLVGNALEARIVVTAINDGAAAVQISAVSLRSTDGGFTYLGPTEHDRGPRLPVELLPLGGQAVWMLDYRAVETAAARVVRDTSPEVRATVQIGTRTYKQNDTIRIPIDGVPPALASLLKRMKARLSSVVTSSFFVDPFVNLSDVDLDKNTSPLGITKRGWGISRSLRLSLVVRHENGQSERVPNVPPIVIPRMWHPQRLVLRVPLVVDVSALPDDSFWWLTTAGKVPGGGYGARSRSEIIAAMTAAGLIEPATDSDPLPGMKPAQDESDSRTQ